MSACGKPTIIERIICLFPGPYTGKCLAFASVFGVPLLLLTRFLDSGTIQNSLAVFGPLNWQNVITFSIANFVLLFYGAYMVKYMRSKIESTLHDLQSLPLENKKILQKVFSPVCMLYPAIILSVLILAASLASFPARARLSNRFMWIQNRNLRLAPKRNRRKMRRSMDNRMDRRRL
jgi:hypothetical protein